MNTPRAIAAALAAAVSFVLPAAGEALTFTLNNSLSEGGGVINWKDKSSYVNASRAPEANDTVIIPSGMTAILSSTDSESWNLVSSLKRITPEDGAKFEVDVDSGEAVLECQVSWYDSTVNPGNIAADLKKGFLVKKGSGALQLKRRDDSLLNAEDRYYDYLVHMDIVAGSVKLPTGEENDSNGYAVGAVNLAKSAEFYMANWNGGVKDKITDFCDITGEGTVKGCNNVRVKLIYTGLSKRTGEFFGSFDGTIWCNFYRNFNYYGDSPNQKTDATRVFNGVALGVVNRSIFGSGNIGGKGYLKYIGDDGSKFLTPTFWIAYEWFSFDAGNAGGIVLPSAGRFLSVGEDFKLLPFILEGENSSVPCVLNNCVNYGTKNTEGRLASIVHIVKRGNGTWRINDHENNQMNGAFDVENGILQFSSIAEKGVRCSLGYSTNLYENVFASTKDKDLYRVPWAFLLGGDDTEGIMEYVGDSDAECSSRPFAVRSRGGIYASSPAGVDLSLSGFSAAGEGRKTLVLGGENTSDNVLKDVSDAKYSLDGKGSLGLEKRGGGVWRLSGEQTFTGPVEVKSGTLIVDNAPAGAPFRYLRFYMKENAFSACINNTADGYYASVKDDDYKRWTNVIGNNGETEFNNVHLYRLHFFGEDGALAVSNCNRTAEISAGEGSLLENTFTFVGENIPNYLPLTNQDVSNMFLSEDKRDEKLGEFRSAFAVPRMPKLDDPSTWACITLRLPDDAPEVFGYDVMMYKSSYGKSAGTNFEELGGRALVSWEVHGSVDGVNFEKLHTVDSFKMWGGADGKETKYWAYDQRNAKYYAYSREGGKFYHFSHTRSLNGSAGVALENVESISVAPGAVLEVHGAKLEIGTLKIGADGAGTFKNVKFAESGKIDIAWNGERSQVFSANFVNAQNAANISKWEISVNGEKDTGGRIGVRDGCIAYTRSGFAVLLR